MSTNPYQAPTAEIQQESYHHDGYDETKFYSPKGRFSRSRYLAYSLAIALPLMLIGIIAAIFIPSLSAGNPEAFGQFFSGGLMIVAIPLFIAFFALTVIMLIRRLHDLNLSGWWVIAVLILAMIPIVGSLTYAFVYFKGGDQGANRFGPPSPPNTTLITIGAWIFGILMALALIANIVIMIMGFTGAAPF